MGDLLIYRSPALIKRDQHRGEFETCPACGESFVIERTVCRYCDESKALVHGNTSWCADGTCPGHAEGNTWKTKVSMSIPPAVYCGPGQRLVVSRLLFFWRRRCEEPGAHLHQSCSRCGWHGIVLPITNDI